MARRGRISQGKQEAAAVSRVAVAVVVIVIIIIAAVAAVALTTGSKPTTSPTTSSSTSSQSTSASFVSSTSSSSNTNARTLTIDDIIWPAGDLNELNALAEIPYPNWLAYTVYQALVTINGTATYQNGVSQVLPMLAENWSTASNGTIYTFDLRHNVTFSSGDAFNSYQVWGEFYGFYYLSLNNSAWLLSYNVFNMAAANFGPSTIALMNQSGLVNPSQQLMTLMTNSSWPIYVNGPYQIVFHLKNAFQWFPDILTNYVGLIFDTQWLLRHGGFGTPAAYNPYFNQHPIPGTGPYVVTNVAENSYVQFQQNPAYWGDSLTAAQIQANPYLDPGHAKNVIVNAKTDDVARYTDLSTGTAQIAGILTQNWPLVLTNTNKYSYFQMPNKSMVFVGMAMNTLRYPTNITAVRQAIAHAINYSDISAKVFFGGLVPMVGPEYPAQSQFYDLGNLPPYQYNVSLAQHILTAAGINTANLPTLEFRVLSGCNYCTLAAEIVQSDLSQVGIQVSIIVTPPSQYAPPYVAGAGSYAVGVNDSQQVAQLTWFGSATFAPAAPTPADAWLLFVNNQTASNNWAIYSNPNVQPCVNAWTDGSSLSTLTSVCTRAQAQVYNDAPYIWLGTIRLVYGAGSVVWNKNVIKGFLLDPIFTGQSSTAIFNTVTFVGG